MHLLTKTTFILSGIISILFLYVHFTTLTNSDIQDSDDNRNDIEICNMSDNDNEGIVDKRERRCSNNKGRDKNKKGWANSNKGRDKNQNH